MSYIGYDGYVYVENGILIIYKKRYTLKYKKLFYYAIKNTKKSMGSDFVVINMKHKFIQTGISAAIIKNITINKILDPESIAGV